MNVVVWGQVKSENSSLPAAVLVSKTRVLKLSHFIITPQLWLMHKQIQHVTQTQSLIGWVLFLHCEPVMAAARLLRGNRRYLTLGCLILASLFGLASFNAFITFSRGKEHLITRSDFVHSLGSLWRPLSTARLQRCTGDQRSKDPIVLRF